MASIKILYQKVLKIKFCTEGIPNLLVRLWHHIILRRRRQFTLLMGLMLISAFAEVVSLGAVLPFLGILIAPEKVFSSSIGENIRLAWGITSADQLVLPLTVAFIAAALIASAIRILLLWASNRLTFAIGADLGIEVYRRTLYQPYRVHVARNSSDVISGITSKVNNVVFGVLWPLLTLVSSIVLLVAITFALIAIDPIVASVAAIGFGASYALITWMSRRQLHRNSQRIAYEQTQVVKALQEGLGGIRDVLLSGTQEVYCDIYRRADHPLRRAQGNNSFIGGSPRYVMEALGMVLIACLAYALSRQVEGIATALPVLGALALGAQRLLPALQNIYSSWASIAGNHASLGDTIDLLDQVLPADALQSTPYHPDASAAAGCSPACVSTQPLILSETCPAPLLLNRDIQFRNVSFRYTDDGPWVLDGLNLTIPKSSRVGFVGSTGSGKSTTLDLLMGLLMPVQGALLVDGQPVTSDLVRAWQQTIAHVPQFIYLADATLAENIAFGIPPEAIDMDRVRKAARQAQIEDFVENSPEGYQAYVGERGIRLSGGQRQRIGIARALYKQASVLVFDEATSALDNSTEQLVMDALDGLDRNLTIMIIAHRLTTLRGCDFIFELKDGRVHGKGAYQAQGESN